MRPVSPGPATPSRPELDELDSGTLGPLIRLAIPFGIGQALALASLVVDRLWVGQVGTEALAALGSAHAIQMILITFAMGMAVGTLAGVARNIGADRPAEAGHFVVQGLYIAVAFGLLTLALAFFVPGPALRLMGAQVEVADPAARYLAITMGGMIAHAPLIAVSFALQGAGEARPALFVGAVAAVLNVALDPLFIFTLDMGMPGAAWATVFSNAAALLVGVWLLGPGRTRIRVDATAMAPQPRVAREIIAVGVPGSLEHVVRTVAGFALVTLVTPFGAHVVSAYTASMVIVMVVIAPGLALGQATASLVGRNLGAQRPRRAWRTAWAGTALYVGAMVVLGGLVFAVAPTLVAAFDRNPAVIAEGAQLLRIQATSFPLVAVALVLSKAFGGAGTTLPAMGAAAVAHLLVQIPLVYLLSRQLGPSGAYAGMALAFWVHGGLSAALFVRRFRHWRQG